MSQFRTSADVIDEVLQKAGEITNGNSPYETAARTYVNKAHHAIIGGGNIFDVLVDEPWTWARAKHPITFDLQPAYTSGSVSVVNGDIDINFSTSPTASLEGWHFQLVGKPTIYKITQHTASNSAAVLDSGIVDTTGSYTFRAFKLDYEVLPTYLYVDDFNDKMNFRQLAVNFTATLTHGAYVPADLLSHVASRMTAAAVTATYGGSYDTVLKLHNVTSSTTFAMLGVTGAQLRRSCLPLLGFDRLDFSAAQSYTSTYTPNQISRLIEPFRIYNASDRRPFIYSSDPIKMQEDYPISLTEQRIPDRFVRLTEENDGTVRVRFNAYPGTACKVSCDWIPQPIDIQDNAASVPALPRQDVDTLIHAAAAMVAFDKNDNKWEGLLKLANAGLEAMKGKNRALLLRTGEFYGQQVPREDLRLEPRRLNYGYLFSGSGSSTAETVQTMIHVRLSYTSFQTNSTANQVLARTLPSTRSLQTLIVKHSTAFAGGAISTLLLDVGTVADPTKFIQGFNVMQAVDNTASAAAITTFYPATDTEIKVQLTATGANLSALSQGSLDLYLQELIVSS